MKKEELALEAQKELRASKDEELSKLRAQAKKEVQEIVKEKVKKDLLKTEYAKILKEEMKDIEGEHKIYVGQKITLGDKTFIGNCVVTTDEFFLIREILGRSAEEVANQVRRKEFTNQVSMSSSGQMTSSTGMLRRQ